MVYKLSKSKILIALLAPLVFASCATINGMMYSEDGEDVSEIKDISVSKRLQISIPIPDNSKYITDKTIIFGEGERFTGVLYLLHDISADEVVEFYRVSMRDDGWSEIAIVRSDFVLMNFDKEDRFATIKVNRKVFDNSSSEVTVGPKTGTTINRSLNIDSNKGSSNEQPFTIQ
ncbi:MAG: hypothetical protein HOC58_04700 [Gammaproteobacteria bacterium]|jgi:hypothetical protein|nr:hypothetical protein [Gammaproteobacteria bacterium]MBT4654359.1 hypothetical protein [Gammaproteobacteria bacterium]MBT7322660.1 hypothetical protein [Gammaproteobacteria bacterium]MDG2159179.1 hypothetical protein [Gammaproteobacteria bacterium]